MDDDTGTPQRPVLVAAGELMASPVVLPTLAATTALTEGLSLDNDRRHGTPRKGICVFSGGTAANSLVDTFQAVAMHQSRAARRVMQAQTKTQTQPRMRTPCPLTYIIPISDNGGSSSELIRFFGGPSVGDIRSATAMGGRLVRLIPTGDLDEGSDDDSMVARRPLRTGVTTDERAALRTLFEHRLCTNDAGAARTEWLDLVESRHVLWTRVPSATRELVRAVLNTLNLEIVKRARPSTSVFNFAGASVGNLFLTGARLFSGSFEAAIYLLSLLCGIPDHVAVVPAINSNFTHHISAGLTDGSIVAGQVNISHPSAPTSLPDQGQTQTQSRGAAPPARPRTNTAVDFEDATLPGSLPVLRQPQMVFSKDNEEDLPARIARVWYINPYGHEIRPQANGKALAALQQASAIVYSIGSLYTSIVPSLVLRGVGRAIRDERGEDRSDTCAEHDGRPKILILNGTLDRETGPRHDPMTAMDFVRAIVEACGQSQADAGSGLQEDGKWRQYVTHVVHLDESEGSGGGSHGPAVDRVALDRLGIECVAVRRRGQEGKARERYDEAALTQVLERLIEGTRNDGVWC